MSSAEAEARDRIAEGMTGWGDEACPCLETCGAVPREDERKCFCPIGPRLLLLCSHLPRSLSSL